MSSAGGLGWNAPTHPDVDRLPAGLRPQLAACTRLVAHRQPARAAGPGQERGVSLRLLLAGPNESRALEARRCCRLIFWVELRPQQREQGVAEGCWALLLRGAAGGRAGERAGGRGAGDRGQQSERARRR